jgi:hypothetical protein
MKDENSNAVELLKAALETLLKQALVSTDKRDSFVAAVDNGFAALAITSLTMKAQHE